MRFVGSSAEASDARKPKTKATKPATMARHQAFVYRPLLFKLVIFRHLHCDAHLMHSITMLPPLRRRFVHTVYSCLQRRQPPATIPFFQTTATVRREFSSNRNRQQQYKQSSGNNSNPNNTVIRATQTAAVALGFALSARIIYSNFLVGKDFGQNHENGMKRRDASKATVLLDTTGLNTTNNTKQLRRDNLDEKILQQVSAAEFTNFCKHQQTILNEAKAQSLEDLKSKFHEELTEAFQECLGRIDSFASWYFAYGTTWKLLSTAFKSAAMHAVSFRNDNQTLSEKVSQDLQDLVCQKYEALVLRPAITDPKIHRAFVNSLKAAHQDYLASINKLETSVTEFISNETSNTTMFKSRPRSTDVIVDVDWKAQLQKVDHIPMTFEKSPEFSVALVGCSAVAGKVLGGGAAAGATKAMLGKLVSPFVTKAVGTTLAGGTAGAAGTAAGAIAGGPVGAAVGAAVGIGVDMTVNAGIGLMQRSSFEKDVKESLEATILEWEDTLFPELERIHDMWFDHAVSMIDGKDHEEEKKEAAEEEVPTTSS